ncbi:MAG: hypothetical protein J7647_11075 [Cyanobacteria bacterium SBLK]|nr:hypothetical protein [Cyanobacteria bacterium SBLK]
MTNRNDKNIDIFIDTSVRKISPIISRCRAKDALKVMGFAAIALFVGKFPAFAQSSPPIFESPIISPFTTPNTPNTLLIRGISGGEIAARNVADRVDTPTGPCVGFVDREPDHIVTLTGFFNFLNIQVRSSADTTIVVSGPGGTWCNDDYQDKNPGIGGQWLEGQYQIWVGSYEKNQYHPYTIQITRGN